ADGRHHLVARPGQVAEQVAAVAVVDQGPGGDGDDEVVGLAAVAVGGHAAAAVVGVPVLPVDDLGEAVRAGDGAGDGGAAVAGVAAVGAAAGDVLFAAEAAAAGAAVAALDKQGDSIHECHDDRPLLSGLGAILGVAPSSYQPRQAPRQANGKCRRLRFS